MRPAALPTLLLARPFAPSWVCHPRRPRRWPEGCNGERCGGSGEWVRMHHGARPPTSQAGSCTPTARSAPNTSLGPPRRRSRWESYPAITSGAGPSVLGVARHIRPVLRVAPALSIQLPRVRVLGSSRVRSLPLALFLRIRAPCVGACREGVGCSCLASSRPTASGRGTSLP